MTDLLYRIDRVETDPHDPQNLRLIAGKWGDGVLIWDGACDVELHRPDGIVISVRIKGYQCPGHHLLLHDVISRELIPRGTEVRVRRLLPGTYDADSPRVITRDARTQEQEITQFLVYTPRSHRGRPKWVLRAGKMELEFARNGTFWFKMHPLLEWVRADVEARNGWKGAPYRRAPTPEEIEQRNASLSWLEQAAAGDVENVVWDQYPDIIQNTAHKLIGRLAYENVMCHECQRKYSNLEILNGRKIEDGVPLSCPNGHNLLAVR
jgi:hypothetical protein